MYNGSGNVSSHLASPSSSGGGVTPRKNPAISYALHPHQVYQPVMIPVPPTTRTTFSASGSGGVGGVLGGGCDGGDFPRRDERFPQWGNQETRAFIEIRAQLEWEFATSKRSKNLWEMVANRMGEKGYWRSPDQCKSKWKNLVCRYKGQEASNVDNVQQFPFFDELQAVFTASATRIQQLHAHFDPEMSSVKGNKRTKNDTGDQSHEECLEEQEEELDTEVEIVLPQRKTSKGKFKKAGENERYSFPAPANANHGGVAIKNLMEIMRSFIQQQQRIDMHWRKQMDKQAEERELFEEEWRQKMEKLERERLMMEQTRWEREEQRKVREEQRAEKRDALLTTLLNKLIQESRTPSAINKFWHLKACCKPKIQPTQRQARQGLKKEEERSHPPLLEARSL